MAGPEKVFENEVKKYLNSENVWYVKYWGGSQFTKAGIPDLICVVNSVFVAIEVKAPKGKPSELQLYNIKKINDCGGVGLILYPKDFDKFKNLIKEIKKWDVSKISKVRNLVNTQL